jgi:hypothetical protein
VWKIGSIAAEAKAFFVSDSVKTMHASEAETFFSVETWQQQLKLKPSLLLTGWKLGRQLKLKHFNFLTV